MQTWNEEILNEKSLFGSLKDSKAAFSDVII